MIRLLPLILQVFVDISLLEFVLLLFLLLRFTMLLFVIISILVATVTVIFIGILIIIFPELNIAMNGMFRLFVFRLQIGIILWNLLTLGSSRAKSG